MARRLSIQSDRGRHKKRKRNNNDRRKRSGEESNTVAIYFT